MLGESYEFTIILLLFVVTLRISPLEEKIILTANFNVTPTGQFLLLSGLDLSPKDPSQQ